MPHQIIFREHYGTQGQEVVYIKPPDQRVIVPLNSIYSQSIASLVLGSFKNIFRVVFLPQGYPESVSKDYFSYQLWDTIQALCSSLNGTLTTQAIMKGVGVGDQAATPLAAAVTWILKDGAGNVGRIVFAWWKGTSLDANCKKWRLCADILNDFAMFLELLLPYFMGYSTALLCAATILKSIVGVAGGATRAALTQHQAIRDNMADVSAKDGSQETCVNLLASVAGIILLTCMGEFQHVWLMFAIFTSMHIYANYRAVKALTISTLNTARLNIVIHTYLETGVVLDPDTVNQKEAVILGKGLSAKSICGHDIVIGESVATFIRSAALTADQLKVLHHLHQGCGYMLVPSRRDKKIYILLQEGIHANSREIVKSYFHSVILGIATCMTKDGAKLVTKPLSPKEGPLLQRLEEALKSSCSSTPSDFLHSESSGLEHSIPQISFINAIMASIQIDATESEQFLNLLQEAGWATSGHHLDCNEWRFIWPTPEKKIGLHGSQRQPT
ncbi:RUS family member 1 [Frankliniella occidentalis]|uniref:RUS family member 1 n=1 Tax=Frankliniella occidentalis TaxID=133901 RepID=A0A6J1RR99_FRAOC|nr:RUS family member 1 [Frankliniella occidentalis]